MKTYLSTIILLCIISCSSEKKSPPNIILFLVDDMGWQDTSVPFWREKTPFNERYFTPNMERLASEGMKFTQAYATPVCSPTRVSLMTGMNAAKHRVTNWTLHKDVLKPLEANHKELEYPMWNVNGLTPDSTVKNAVWVDPLPAVLQKAGYYTIHSGKAHLGAIGTPAENPLNIGFDVNIAGHAAGAPRSYLGLENFGNKEDAKKSPWPVPGLEKYHGKDIFLTEALTRESILALEDPIQKNQPFFLYQSLYGIHTPIMADQRFVQKYYEMGLDSTEAQYASMIEAMDKSLGDLMDFIEKKGIADNTIILFMSDNGGLSAHTRGGERHTHNKPLKSGKGSIYEGGIREPMIVKWPNKVEANSICYDYLIIEDFFPTILEMAGVDSYETIQEIDGISFVSSLLGDKAKTNQRPLYWHYPNRWGAVGPGTGTYSAVRKDDWKLIHFHDEMRVELYNIEEDIGEENNLIDSQKEKALELANLLTDYLKEVNGQMPKFKKTQKAVPWSTELIKEN